ncbi:MAG: isocitrate lyase/phosphoenolpyruvate mutase family protein [Alphaproteobacteria bacterium]|nr:isocitrate lyase/phosphoenolpyruvate mutase family protein [Alphaproteobacteria bacterium]
MNQIEKGDAFLALHQRGAPFVIPNPWDAGSARMMAVKGFEALATTSAGVDHVHGLRSGSAGRDQIIANARDIVAATELPVSVDLEDCFGSDEDGIAETIRLAADAGAVGGSIEDSIWGNPSEFYAFDVAVARVRAAVAAVAALPFKFTLTARCEFMLYGHADLDATIERLRAYAEAGADVIFAPGIRTREQVEAVVDSVDKPVNVLLGLSNTALDMADMHRLGVARVSLGSGIHTAAMKAAADALDEIRERGSFGFTTGLPKVDSLLGV